jgi:ABC-type molybdenum transport system ATPase subunit/photorepair protein PhrA
MDECMGTLESMVGKCSDARLEEECITVRDAISFLLSGLDATGKRLTDVDTTMKARDTMMNEKFRSSEESVQATFSNISKSFQELVIFTKTLSVEQAILSQRPNATPQRKSLP